MVNYRRVLCEAALLSVFIALVNSAPTYPEHAQVYYDQRQNGTENVRLKIDGVVIAIVPAEPLFSALGDVDDILELLDSEEFGEFKPKPSTSTSSPPASIEGKPEEDKPQEKPLLEKSEETKLEEKKPDEVKPETKPEVPTKSDVSEKPAEASLLSDVSLNDDLKIQKKEILSQKQESASRLKNRLASFLVPLLKQAHHLAK